MLKRFLGVCLTAVLLLAMPAGTVGATSPEPGGSQVEDSSTGETEETKEDSEESKEEASSSQYGLTGIEITYYADGEPKSQHFYANRVGEMKDGQIVYSNGYEKYQLTSEKTDSLARLLADYTTRYAPVVIGSSTSATGNTSVSAKGICEFKYLDPGLYLIWSDIDYYASETGISWAQPLLVEVVDNQMTKVEPKYIMYEPGDSKETSLTVTKEWDTEEHPDKVSVDLLKNGHLEEVIRLSDENDWSYTWDDLSTKYVWSVVETEVPEDYTLSRDDSKEGTMVLTNSTGTADDNNGDDNNGDENNDGNNASGDPSNPSNPSNTGNKDNTGNTNQTNNTGKLPQTGMMRLPILLLVLGSLVSAGIGGYFLYQNKRKHHEK